VWKVDFGKIGDIRYDDPSDIIILALFYYVFWIQFKLVGVVGLTLFLLMFLKEEKK